MTCLLSFHLKLPCRECELVEVHRVRRLVVVAIDLVVDRHSVPTGVGWRVIPVQGCRIAIQSNGFKQQVTIGGTLYLDREMVPCVALRIAGDPTGHPMLAAVAPGIPLMATVDAALVAPDVGLPTDELVDIEFQRLRVAGVSDPEIHVISEIVERRNQGLAEVRQPLRGEVADQVIVPEDVSPLSGTTVVARLGGHSVHGWRANVLNP